MVVVIIIVYKKFLVEVWIDNLFVVVWFSVMVEDFFDVSFVG